MKKLIQQNKHLVRYLIEFDSFRKDRHSLILAQTFFNQKEYAWAIKELKNAMGISENVKIKVRMHSQLEKPANIELPINFYGTIYSQSHVYIINIRKSEFESFEVFVINIAHELAHLFMFLNKNPLWDNEKATDTLAMITGFGDYFYNHRNNQNHFQMFKKSYGYLSDEELNFVYLCFSENKKFRAKKKKKWYQKILQKIQI